MDNHIECNTIMDAIEAYELLKIILTILTFRKEI